MAQHPSNLSLKETLQNHIQQDLASKLDEDDLKRIEYYSDDGFFFLEDNYRLEVVESILEFYENQKVSDLYQKLAQLPFHLVLSLSPDKLMVQTCEQLGLPYHFHFYNKKKYNSSLDKSKLDFKPALDNRLIYNIFGCIDNEDSLILSYDDLFEFLQRVFNNYKLPKTIEEAIFEANFFVFVGFNYSTWYLKLLLRLMKMHEKIRKVFGMDEPLRKDLETFFVNEFDMNFTRQDTADFVNDLYQKCDEAGMLLQAGAPSSFRLSARIYDQVTQLIAEGKLGEAFGEFEKYMEQNPVPNLLKQEFILLKSRFKILQKDQRAGILDDRDYRRQLNLISHDFLKLINAYRP